MNFFNKMAEKFLTANRRLKKWQRVVSVLAAVVVFVTTYALVLPAITLDKETASTQAGMEIVASEQEPGSDGTVYEAEPEEEPDEVQAESGEAEPQAESASEDSGSQEAEASEDKSTEAETEESGQETVSKEEEPAAAAAETCHLSVEVNIYIVWIRQFHRMRGYGKLHIAPGQYRCRHLGQSTEDHSMLFFVCE